MLPLAAKLFSQKARSWCSKRRERTLQASDEPPSGCTALSVWLSVAPQGTFGFLTAVGSSGRPVSGSFSSAEDVEKGWKKQEDLLPTSFSEPKPSPSPAVPTDFQLTDWPEKKHLFPKGSCTHKFSSDLLFLVLCFT